MKRRVLALVIALPLMSVVAVCVLYLLANQHPDLNVLGDDLPLSKMSWREEP